MTTLSPPGRVAEVPPDVAPFAALLLGSASHARGRGLRHRSDGAGRLTGAIRRPIVRLYIALAATWLAFGAGIASLANGFRFSTTTGELVVVPIIVTGLLHLVIRRHDHLWNGRLGHGDYVGVAVVIATAVGIVWWRPAAELNDGALKRLDLLVLPLVLAAAAILMLGLRVLLVGAFPLLFAFLAWPYPWTLVENRTITVLAELTYAVSSRLATVTGAGEPLPEAGDNVLRVGDGAAAFEISVAPACSGFTGLVAYAILGGAALFVLRGGLLRKLAWLGAGLVLVWVATVVRILLLALVGDVWGNWAALQLLHPVAGLGLDALVFVAMLAAAGAFGLRAAHAAHAAHGPPPPGLTLPPPPTSSVSLRIIAVVVLAGTVLALNVVGIFGPQTAAMSGGVHRAVTLRGMEAVDADATLEGAQPWSRVFFGGGSTWNRYRVRGTFPDGRRHSVWVDSIVVTDSAALHVHPVLECYTFHQAQVLEQSTQRLAAGVTASAIVVQRPEGDIWYSLHWQWPVVVDDELRYERVVLMTAQPARTGAVAVTPDAVQPPVTVDRGVIAGLTGTAARMLAHPAT